jgi:tetratricopeptide (TPR) repeat protein
MLVCPAAAKLPSQPGDEIGVGTNSTGEPCRLRLVGIGRDAPRVHRFGLFCEGWTAPSGEIRQWSAGPKFEPTWMVTESPWYKYISARTIGGCRAPEPTSLAGGASASFRECVREGGNWSVVILAARVGSRAYLFETLPANLRVLERAVEMLEGNRAPEQLAERGGSASPAIRRAEAIVNATGLPTSVKDVGILEAVWELAESHYRSQNYPAAEAAYRRLIEIRQRLFGANQPGDGAIFDSLARTLSEAGRFADAEQFFTRAEPLTMSALGSDDYPRHLQLMSWHLQLLGRFAEALAPAEQSLRQ